MKVARGAVTAEAHSGRGYCDPVRDLIFCLYLEVDGNDNVRCSPRQFVRKEHP